MLDITLDKAASMSCQLNSLLMVLAHYSGEMSEMDRGNLTELALTVANHLTFILNGTDNPAFILNETDMPAGVNYGEKF